MADLQPLQTIPDIQNGTVADNDILLKIGEIDNIINEYIILLLDENSGLTEKQEMECLEILGRYNDIDQSDVSEETAKNIR